MNGLSVVAAAATCVAVLLAWPSPPPMRHQPGVVRRGGPWQPVLLGAAIAIVLTQVVQGTRLVAGLIGIVAAVGVHRLVSRARRTAAAERVADLVLGVCDGMAADLRAGQTPEAALTRGAADWAPLKTVATAAQLGGDVPRALRDLAVRPGAEALRTVAAAWQVSHRSGAGLSAALSQVVQALRERRRTSRMVSSELASARATAHVMAALPVGVLLMGSGVGGDPVAFLLDTPVGLGCLGLGVTLALCGLFWLQHISDAVEAR